ncbi:MAG: hypothetical protein ACYTFG_17880 [Planctomycetota bacterium]|jgi:hypothetical protein
MNRIKFYLARKDREGNNISALTFNKTRQYVIYGLTTLFNEKGITDIPVNGYWEGIPEKTNLLVLDTNTEVTEKRISDIKNIASDVKELHNQFAVYFTVEKVNGKGYLVE